MGPSRLRRHPNQVVTVYPEKGLWARHAGSMPSRLAPAGKGQPRNPLYPTTSGQPSSPISSPARYRPRLRSRTSSSRSLSLNSSWPARARRSRATHRPSVPHTDPRSQAEGRRSCTRRFQIPRPAPKGDWKSWTPNYLC